MPSILADAPFAPKSSRYRAGYQNATDAFLVTPTLERANQILQQADSDLEPDDYTEGWRDACIALIAQEQKKTQIPPTIASPMNHQFEAKHNATPDSVQGLIEQIGKELCQTSESLFSLEQQLAAYLRPDRAEPGADRSADPCHSDNSPLANALCTHLDRIRRITRAVCSIANRLDAPDYSQGPGPAPRTF